MGAGAGGGVAGYRGEAAAASALLTFHHPEHGPADMMLPSPRGSGVRFPSNTNFYHFNIHNLICIELSKSTFPKCFRH